MASPTVMHYITRLKANLLSERLAHARFAVIHAELVEQGVDTSVPSPAQSPDTTLAQAEARVAQATKALADYKRQHGVL